MQSSRYIFVCAALLCAAMLVAPRQAAARPHPAQASGTTPIDASAPAESPAQEAEAASLAPGLPPLVTDRPDATESAETVGRGRFQLETGYTYASVERSHLHSFGEFLVRVGVIEALELRVILNALVLDRGDGGSSSGLQNLGLGMKFRVLEGGGVGHARPTVALLAGTTILTGSSNVDDPRPRPEARLATAWDLTERFSVSSNVIWSSIQEDETEERFAAWGLSVALGYGLSDRWGSFLEYFGAYPSGDRDSEHFVDAGLTYLLSNDLQLDGRVGYRLDSPGDDFFFGFGTSVRW